MASHFKYYLLRNLNMLSELFTNGLAEKTYDFETVILAVVRKCK